MVSKEELKQTVIFGPLADGMLDKLVPNVELIVFKAGERIFKEGDIANRFYMLKRGTVLLEKRISDDIRVCIETIKSGFSFGWSAMFDIGNYTTEATCSETSEVISIQRDNILKLMENDHSLGYIISQRLLREIKSRLDIRVKQILRAISSDPDLKSLL